MSCRRAGGQREKVSFYLAVTIPMADVPRVKWSFQLARIAGIDVRVHATFFLLLAWFAVVYYADGGYLAAINGLIFIVLLFVCVVLHEFGHALAARAFGINTPDITLLPIGGIARLERMPEKPSQELLVALAGPAVNVVIALGLYLVLGRIFTGEDWTALLSDDSNLLSRLLAINIILVVFNLLPAFPMDGGRVLRSLLAMRISHARATKVAAVVGQTCAVVFGLLAVSGGNPFLLFIAVFVFFGARTEASFAMLKDRADHTNVGHIMQPIKVVLFPDMRIAEAAAQTMASHERFLPIVDQSLNLLGGISSEAIEKALRWDPSAKLNVLPRQELLALITEASLSEAARLLENTAIPLIFVVNRSGQVVGQLDRKAVAAALGQ